MLRLVSRQVLRSSVRTGARALSAGPRPDQNVQGSEISHIEDFYHAGPSEALFPDLAAGVHAPSVARPSFRPRMTNDIPTDLPQRSTPRGSLFPEEAPAREDGARDFAEVPEGTRMITDPPPEPKGGLRGAIEHSLQSILDSALHGNAVFAGAKELAGRYAGHVEIPAETRASALINTECAKGFGAGFVTGFGGMTFAPIALPAAVLSCLTLQARMAGAIAHIYGHDISDPGVRMLILSTMLGNRQGEVLQDVAGMAGLKVAREFLMVQFPLQMLASAHHHVVRRVAMQTSIRAASSVSRAIPLLGGVVGGSLDASFMYIVGQAAVATFKAGPPRVPVKTAVPSEEAAPAT